MSAEVVRQQFGLKHFVDSGQYRQFIYGLQWGDPRQDVHLVEVVNRFMLPFFSSQSTVVEIGAGGGRWSRELIGRAGRLILVDGIPEFETAIRHHFHCARTEFLVSTNGLLSPITDATIDFVFSFDTFVHFHRDLFDRYVASISRILKPGGNFCLHHARHYENSEFNPQCFQYRADDEVACLLAQNKMQILDVLSFRGGFGSRLVRAQKPHLDSFSSAELHSPQPVN